jgi:hypothetical protein
MASPDPEKPPDDKPPDDKPPKSKAAVAGSATFLLGAVGTIVAAIGDFGSDDSGLAAARRNHVWWLIAAASLAAAGLFLGALYVLLRSEFHHARHRQTAHHAHEAHRRRNLLPLLLLLGIVAVATGVGIGAYATIDRRPGRPKIEVVRLDDRAALVSISAEGLPSNSWYEASVEAYADKGPPWSYLGSLARARFSPGQDGKLEWNEQVSLSKIQSKRVGRVEVRVARGMLAKPLGKVGERSCTAQDVTCLFVRVPPKAPATPTASTTSTTTQSATTG